jgi:oligoendopeptidase F
MKVTILFVTEILLFVLQNMNIAAQTQQTFDAFPKRDEAEYHLNFAQFFPTAETQKSDLEKLNVMMDELSSLKGKTIYSADNLLHALILWDSILINYNRQYSYFYLLSAVNTEDAASTDMYLKIDADFSGKTAFFESELSELSDEEINNFLKDEPSLKKYEFYLRDVSRYRKYLIQTGLEKQLSELNPLISEWQFDLYENIINNISFESLSSTRGKLNPLQNRSEIETNKDSSVRYEGFRNLFSGLNSMRSLFAFTFRKAVDADERVAKIHGFADGAESHYYNFYSTKESVNTLLKEISDSTELYKHYQQLRADYLGKILGRKAHYWDLHFSPNNLTPRYTIDSAVYTILHALNPLGEEYNAELKNLLNPSNGRMEIAPGKKKRSGGFSRGFIGVTSVFYSQSYNGYYNDVRVLTHESTHAIHRQLMTKGGVLPVYAFGPNYLFESFAIFSEFLLSDYLIKHSNTNEEKRYFLEKYFDGKGMVLFYAAEDALLEQAIHEGISNGTLQSADDLDSLNANINDKFSIWSSKEYPQLNMRWITNSLFYEDPFYNINYVLGSMLALKYYQLYNEDRVNFVKNYIKLMKNGFDGTPETLLKQILKININNNSLLTGALRTIRMKVAELEKIYKEK